MAVRLLVCEKVADGVTLNTVNEEDVVCVGVSLDFVKERLAGVVRTLGVFLLAVAVAVAVEMDRLHVNVISDRVKEIEAESDEMERVLVADCDFVSEIRFVAVLEILSVLELE